MKKRKAKKKQRPARKAASPRPARRKRGRAIQHKARRREAERRHPKPRKTIRKLSRPVPKLRPSATKKPAVVLVTGATGKQGGAVAQALLRKGFAVRAFTRKPESAAAMEMKNAGAAILQGSFDDKESLEKSVKGAEIVFAMSTPFEGGAVVETSQGVALADAAKAAGIKHFVYTSVGNADKGTGVPHFDSKFKVEQHIREIGIPFTIIAPVFFMENLVSPWSLPAIKGGQWMFGLPASRKLQQIAVSDIASFAALVIEDRNSFLGKRIDIASDDLTGAEAVGILSRVSGRTIEYIQQPVEQIRAMGEDFAKMSEWFDRVGYSADIPMLRKTHSKVVWHTFEAWAKVQDWSQLLA